jgi:hypothetical protein
MSNNMSYCRFHNTLLALLECEQAIFHEEKTSAAEAAEMVALVKICMRIIEGFNGAIDDKDEVITAAEMLAQDMSVK